MQRRDVTVQSAENEPLGVVHVIRMSLCTAHGVTLDRFLFTLEKTKP